MIKREVQAMVVTNDYRTLKDRFPGFLTERYVLKANEVVSPEECLNSFETFPANGDSPDVLVLTEGISDESQKEIIESRKQHPRIRQRPVLVRNGSPETYDDRTVASLDRIYQVENKIDKQQFRRILLDLQAFWYPDLAG